MIAQCICLHDFHRLQLLQSGLLRDLVLALISIMLQVAHVGDIADIAHLVAKMFEELEQHVIGHAGSGMAEVGVAIHGRTANIHTHVSRMDRDEQFFFM